MKHRILVIGDTHFPFEHTKYLDLCRRKADEFKCNTIIHVGDVADNHAISYHEKDPSLPGAEEELEMTLRRLKVWQKEFPEVKVCIGNHCSLPVRKIKTAGLVPKVFTGYANYYETPKWDWQREFIVPAFHHHLWFRHSWASSTMAKGGTGGYSVICGHKHTESGFRWSQFPNHSSFSLYTGCGINAKSAAFDYGRDNGNLPVISCATIIDGEPQIHRLFK